MRVSIVTDDRTVVVDGEGYEIDDDMTALRSATVTAIQWYDDFGEREFGSVYLKDEKRWHREPNEMFDDPAEVMAFVERWKVAKAREDAKARAREEAMAKALEDAKARGIIPQT